MIDLKDQTRPSGNGTSPNTIDTVLDDTIGTLSEGFGNADLTTALSEFGKRVPSLDPIQRRIARSGAINALDKFKVRGAAGMVDAALAKAAAVENGESTGPSVAFEDVEPAGEPQDGDELLNDLSEWYRRYIYFPDGEPAADATAGWTLATLCVDHVYFAPLLILPSPTKAAGKTTLLDLLSHTVRRGHLTSAFGATGAVVFRLNDAHNPTFLIDEAERLSGRHADRDLVNLLNQGHRRGGKVDRCKQLPSGGFEVESFDAFGFRALALIGKPWDTLLDRGIVVRLERKPRGTKLARFGARKVKAEGQALASRIARWAGDNVKAVGDIEATVPRPEWLSDRGCDNWSPIFAVAAVAGGVWPDRLATAAKALQNAIEDDGDRGERVLLDIGRIFEDRKYPVAIASGELVAALNELEESDWAGERSGAGLSPQRLAALLRLFRIRPRQARVPGSGAVIRGYWFVDVEPVLEPYILPAQSGTVVQPVHLVHPTPEEASKNAGCTGVPVVPVQAGRDRSKEDTTLVHEPDPDEEARIAMREGA